MRIKTFLDKEPQDIDDVIFNIKLAFRDLEAITWPKEDWDYLKEFAEANGFENLKQGFSYMRLKHFYDNF